MVSIICALRSRIFQRISPSGAHFFQFPAMDETQSAGLPIPGWSVSYLGGHGEPSLLSTGYAGGNSIAQGPCESEDGLRPDGGGQPFSEGGGRKSD